MDKKYISARVDAWIASDDVPKGHLKPVRKFDGLYPEDPDEAEAYFDWLAFHMELDVLLLKGLSNPKSPQKYWAALMQLERENRKVKTDGGNQMPGSR